MSSMAAPPESPQFDHSLPGAVARGARAGVKEEPLRRLRALLLLGRKPGELRAAMPRVISRLEETGSLLTTTLLDRQDVGDGATKLLVGLGDGQAVESVVLSSSRGVSVCLSSQVGCPVGCRFCASGAAGLVRNLRTHEIVEQLVHARRVRSNVDRLVVMGIGEPLLNAPALFRALDIIRLEGGIGPRRMVVSTVGVRGAIPRLGRWGVPVTLALSLHAPDDALRARLIPSLGGASISDLLAEMDQYIARTRRKALAEYTLLAGVNDGDDLARRTGERLRGRQIYLNVIPYNPVPGATFRPVSRERARRFAALVRQNGAFATVRRTLGAAACAACGQLRAVRAAPRVEEGAVL